MSGFQPAVTGYFGKLPARGDFLRAGLPEDFVAAWDGWCRAMLAASRATLGEAWEAAWMEAPVWRFLLPPGACGAQAALGVWLPSLDRAGRHFPFAIAALAASMAALETGEAWLARAEDLAVAAIVEDAPHEALTAALAGGVAAGAPMQAGWWTAGSPRVAPCRWSGDALPGLAQSGAMLSDPVAVAEG
jgi:type VI secretion system protein ImpM